MRLELLGAVRVREYGQEIMVGPPKQQAVLGVLAARLGETVSIEEIVDAVWGEQVPPTAVNAVHTYVAGLRRELQLPRQARCSNHALVSQGDGYALWLRPESVDARTFERRQAEARQLAARGEHHSALDRLESALELWRGDAYAGVPGPFAGAERARLQELRMAAVEDWGCEMLLRGRYTEAVVPLTEMTAKEPLREELRALLMLALQGCGRRAQALEVYRETWALLRRELGIEPGARLQALHQRILTDDPLLLALDRPTVRGTAAPAATRVALRTVRPAQVPPTARGFVGRTGELTALRRVMARSVSSPHEQRTVVAVVEGAPGTGKSALALRLAHEMDDRFPDGQLFVDLGGSSLRGRPVTAAEAQVLVLRGLGVPEGALPPEPAERTALYRRVLASRRTLLFLDDVPRGARLDPLLSGPSCVLLTSRWRQADLARRHAAHRVTLRPLAADESVDLIQLLAGPRPAAEPEATLRLARLCGHLPLALRIAAQALVEEPGLSVAELADAVAGNRLGHLTVVDDATASLDISFRNSYRALPEDAARMFRLLGLYFAQDITVPVAATLAGTCHEQARRRLDALAEAHLVEETGEDRYRIPDLLHAYAGKCADEEPIWNRTAALARLLRRTRPCRSAAPLPDNVLTRLHPMGPHAAD
ncbi:BTAD domain-containing putative transcriptional regulator [Streptomyces sp. NPDC058847]|uniref:AfsR/SARP family transcriptional regulator n=1 Tax=Streptomyces sp. NPDC058847 TaxID=3346649 RepID=UPI0036CD7DAD